MIRLRPPLRRRIVLLIGSLALLALAVAALASGSVAIGVVGVVLFGAFASLAAARLLLPRSYLTEVDAHGFRVHDSFGRLVHHVHWRDVDKLVPVPANSWKGPGTATAVGWRLRPGAPRAHRGRLQWARGGRYVDGSLPDYYLGFEETARRMIEAAGMPVVSG
jgi:hypothetical protein